MQNESRSDVVVIGGGVLGLCSAYHCAKAGRKVVVLEADRIGARASGGIVGAMSPHVPDQWNPKKQFQLDALISAKSFWADVDQLSDCKSNYGRIGRLIPILNEQGLELAKARCEGAKELWPAPFCWDVVQRHPLVSEASAPYGLIRETLSARIHPASACSSLAHAVRNLGGEIYEGCTVTELEPGRVIHSGGQMVAKTIILAGGVGGFDLLSGVIKRPIGAGVKGQALTLKADLGDAPQIFADGIYIVPHNRIAVSVGSTSENVWNDPRETDAALDDVHSKAVRICPALAKAKVTQRWADVRPKAPKRDPLLGPVEGWDGLFLALGGFKIGFGIAHKVGEIMSRYALAEPVDLPASFTLSHHLGQPAGG